MDSRTVSGTRELTAPGEGRIDAVVAAAFPGLSRARVQRLLACGAVTLNGAPARKSDRVAAGDLVRITIDEHEPAAVLERPPELPILYEDGDLVAIDKPAGLVVHGAPGDRAPSVAGWFLARYPGAARHFDVDRPGIVHRLDRDTSGVLVLAKTPAAQAALSAAFESRTVVKLYVAVVDGVPPQREAIIEAPIGRHPGDRTRMAVVRRGRPARTGYEVLGDDGRHAVLLVRLYTGRTHQVRVHLAAIGTPVANDAVYGRPGTGRQLLHAWRLTLPHPRGGELEVTAPLPEDIAAVIRGMGLETVASHYCSAPPPARCPGGEESEVR